MSEKMKVVAIVGEKETGILELDRPNPEPDQILVNIKGCAICTWEQRVFLRKIPTPLPFIGGHEVAGVIAGVGENINEEEFPIGTKVTVRTLAHCGKCPMCRSGADNLCREVRQPTRKKRSAIPGPGGMSEFICADAAAVYKMPDKTPFERIVFTEPLACVLTALDKVGIQFGDDVVVIGGGVMGQLIILCAKLSGARVILSEPDSARCAKAQELGCDITFNPMEQDPVEFIHQLTDGKGAEVVINTVTPKIAVTQSINMTAKHGHFLQFGLVMPNEPIPVNFNKLHDNEVFIAGSLSPDIHSFYRAANMLAKEILKPDELGLMSEVFDYTNANAAFEASKGPDTYRVMVKF